MKQTLKFLIRSICSPRNFALGTIVISASALLLQLSPVHGDSVQEYIYFNGKAVPIGRTSFSQTNTAFLEGVDSDGDGRVGVDEDHDGNDEIYGTLAGIPGFGSEVPAIPQPGVINVIAPRIGYNHVVVVSSGIFHQSLTKVGVSFAATEARTIEAAPGVSAVFDANDKDGGWDLHDAGTPAIQITHQCTLKNLTFRNWKVGVVVKSGGSVILENCTFEDISDSNTGVFGLDVEAGGHAVVKNCTFTRCGKLNGTAGGAIRFQTGAEGFIIGTTIVGNYGVGLIRDEKRVRLMSDTIIARNAGQPLRRY